MALNKLKKSLLITLIFTIIAGVTSWVFVHQVRRAQFRDEPTTGQTVTGKSSDSPASQMEQRGSTEPQESSNLQGRTIPETEGSHPGCVAADFEFWKQVYESAKVGTHVYDVGSNCKLSSGEQLVSFAYYSTSIRSSGKRSVVLFDTSGRPLRETSDFSCETLGDFVAPTIELNLLDETRVSLVCSTSDGGFSLTQRFNLNLVDFRWATATAI